MKSSNSLPNSRNYIEQQTLLLPPKMSTSRYDNEIGESSSSLCLKEEGLISDLGEGLRRHQRTYSDSLLNISEQQQQQQDNFVPLWLKDLLDDEDDEDEYEPPLSSHQDQKKPISAHRRSSSDSLAYLHNNNNNKILLQQYSNIASHPQPPNFFLNSKRVKRHSAQHYRARKVQYIGELETSIQVLQAEGYEVSAELEFLDQQNLILGMENSALKQRLDSLSQEHFIKCLEQEMLEREIARLRNLYHQQQQHKQQQKLQKHHGRNQSNKRQDLESSITKLSMKNKGTESSQKAR